MQYKGIIIFLFAFISCGSDENQTDLNSSEFTIDTVYSLKVSNVSDEKFGYKIYKNNKLLINQYLIPGVGGKSGFSSHDEAKRVAELVVYKLSNSIFPPTITAAELDSMNIRY